MAKNGPARQKGEMWQNGHSVECMNPTNLSLVNMSHYLRNKDAAQAATGKKLIGFVSQWI